MTNNYLTKSSFFIMFLVCVVFIASSQVFAATAREINVRVDATLDNFYKDVTAAKKLANGSEGILVFPSVIKAGFGFGGEYGEGALRIRGKTVEYYSTIAASFGFQLGVQSKAVILMFMTQKALKDFRNSDGWEVGVDGSIALVKIGAGGSIDTSTIKSPVIGFVFGQKGLMYNLTLEGSKMTKIKK